MSVARSGSEPIDVFVSYAKEDRGRIEPLVDILRRNRLVVWWAEELRNGRRWRAEIEDKLEAARKVLVVWTQHSTRRESFVREEAQFAAECDKLMQIVLDKPEKKPLLPLGFREFQYEDLSDWTPQAARDLRLERLIIDLSPPKEEAARPAPTVDSRWPTSGVHQRRLAMHKPAASIDDLADAVALAASGQDTRALEAATMALKSALAMAEQGLDTDEAEELLETLRNQRRHEQVIEIAETLLGRSEASAKAQRLYAQSLIDTGRVNLAIGLLRTTRDRISTKDKEFPEVMGLLGRSYKQLYVNDRRRPPKEAAQKALRTSIGYYAEALSSTNPAERPWHRINLIAMQALADREGVEARRYVEPKYDAQAMIKALDANSADPWQHASLGEASVAAGDFHNAARHYGRFLAHPETSPFHINSALRQLKEIWQLKPGNNEAGQLLMGLEAQLAARSGGALVIEGSGLSTRRYAVASGELPVFNRLLQEASGEGAAEGDPIPETIVGDHKARPREWFQEMLKRTAAVARIKLVGGGTIGTGFLIRGSALSSGLGDEPFILTNAHVVSGGSAREGLQSVGMSDDDIAPASPADIRVAFEESPRNQPEGGFQCSIVWESPVALLDAALLRLEDVPAGVEPCPIAGELPDLTVKGFKNARRNSRVFVIGHPLGGDLSISMEDCDLLSIGPKERLGDRNRHIQFLHYRTPTERGNSGSPVFGEVGWKVVALHHFGSVTRTGTIATLDGKTQERANEGISILSIKAALEQAFPGRAAATA
jgi:hypothetical protein